VIFAIDSIRALQEGVILWSRLAALLALAAVAIGVSVHRFRKVTL